MALLPVQVLDSSTVLDGLVSAWSSSTLTTSDGDTHCLNFAQLSELVESSVEGALENMIFNTTISDADNRRLCERTERLLHELVYLKWEELSAAIPTPSVRRAFPPMVWHKNFSMQPYMELSGYGTEYRLLFWCANGVSIPLPCTWNQLTQKMSENNVLRVDCSLFLQFTLAEMFELHDRQAHVTLGYVNAPDILAGLYREKHLQVMHLRHKVHINNPVLAPIAQQWLLYNHNTKMALGMTSNGPMRATLLGWKEMMANEMAETDETATHIHEMEQWRMDTIIVRRVHGQLVDKHLLQPLSSLV